MTTVSTTSTVNQTASSTAANQASAAASTKTSSASVDYNDFLKLMVAELKNQDPTAPTNPTQYLSQIASFSSVEQQVNTNTKLDTMLTAQAFTQADAAIGRTVTSKDGHTSGVVKSVAIGKGGALTATLTNGSTLVLGTGTTLS